MTLAEAIQNLEKKKTADNAQVVINVLKRDYNIDLCGCATITSLIQYAKNILKKC